MSKFMNYVKKFLALSFMSATAAFLMSCNSNILGTVQIVEKSEYNASAEAASSIKTAAGLDQSKDYKIYKDKSDSKNSVLYVETETGKTTAVVTQDGATVKAGLGSANVGGTPSHNTGKIAATTDVKNMTLDSWDETTKIEATENLKLDEFKAINLSKDSSKTANSFKGNLPFIPSNCVYDSKTGTLLASSSKKSPFVKDLSNGSLYAATNDTLDEFKKSIVAETALNTAVKLDIKLAGSSIDPQQQKLGITKATKIEMSYEPTGGDNSYYENASFTGTLYPLSQFASQVAALTGKTNAADTMTTCKNNLETCINEYSKLTATAKKASEVEYTDPVNKKTEKCTPQAWLGSLATQYVLAASVKDLYEAKNGKVTEDAILDSIGKNTLSSEDKQYLLNMIQKNYNDLDELYGKEVQEAATLAVNDLKKQIQDGSSSGGSSSGSGSKGSGSSSGSSSSKNGSSSRKSGSSASIKTGSDSLFMLFSSLGLSSGTLLSLRKKKND